MQKANFELIYRKSEETIATENLNKAKEFNHCLSLYPAKAITEVYDRSEHDAEIVYTKINDVNCFDGNKCKCTMSVVGMEEEPEEISLKEFRSKLRKFYPTRIKSTEFTVDTIIKDDSVIELKVRFIRDIAKVVLATAYIPDNVKVTSALMNEIQTRFGDRLPNFINGRPTEATFTKISSANESHYIPYKKLVPYYVDFTRCRKLAKYLNGYNMEIADQKWIRTRTGLIIVKCHNGEMTNILTNNKIHYDYVVEECPAFDVQMLRTLSGDNSFSYTTVRDLANKVINRLKCGIITPQQFNNRFRNIFEKRFKWIKTYEELRTAKRSLAKMGGE